MGLICDHLQRKGIHAIGFNYFDSYFDYDGVMATEAYELVKAFDHYLESYDLFHYHHGLSALTDNQDLLMVRNAGKKLIMHHRGNDVRARSRAKKGPGYTNPYVDLSGCLPDDQIHKNLKLFAKVCDAAIVQDYELYGYVIDYYRKEGKPVHVLPRLVDFNRLPASQPRSSNGNPVIIHAPTQLVV
ncbi:hypothetical protein CR205_02905 [Alteribacter lacisalsi]|uniref:Glycosyltransferase family 1 protein n=1 Tax=Alteribacter lacisalsi TaxID=2045244 RepID=A0A2W0H9F6_9BACI|nr:hypothetical protein [Alteribacter lacisalsi]PYZ97561.1 hypothetical protein CR205_02905 [Alteribacter lacisalsi]